MNESWCEGGGKQMLSPKAHPGQGQANSPAKRAGKYFRLFGPQVSAETTHLQFVKQKQPRSLWKQMSTAPFQ